MNKIKELVAGQMRVRLTPEKLPFADSQELMTRSGKKGPALSQPRALEALQLGLHIADRGYNIYVAGEPNLGRTFLVQDFLRPWAAKNPVPPDMLYVYNFVDPDKPRLIRLPAGQGRKLKQELAQAVAKIRKDIPAHFEKENYVNKRQALVDKFQKAKEQLVDVMEHEAADQGFNLDVDEQGSLTLYPLVEGKRLSEEEFERLDPTVRKRLKSRSERLMSGMAELVRKISLEERGLKQGESTLDAEIVREVLAEYIEPLAALAKEQSQPELEAYFGEFCADVLDNIDQFTQREAPMPQFPFAEPHPGGAGQGDGFFVRYDVNLLVDNSETKGAPIIVEDHPTAFNLLGCIERESELGALVTDFSLIKAGSLHRANNGFLILHVEDLIANSTAWEGLLRALRSGQARFEDQGDGQDQARTKTIEPAPIPLQVKVILIGTDDTYELLLDHEDRFLKLFKIKAHLQESQARTPASIRAYFLQLCRVIGEAGLPPFTRDALAGLVDYSSRLVEDQKKLSLKLPILRELMVEAAAFAAMEGKTHVDGAALQRAVKAKEYRSNLYEEEFMEAYDRALIKVSTTGESVGRVNGLSVSWYGDYEVGLPHHIACTVGVGEGGIVDLEREAQLGGPIHTKAMMILKSYLISQFAQNKPLVLTGSLCFEQNYAHVEGDSASGAELAALLSALAGVPIRLSLAVTGAVNQSGGIMAVGGVTRKIEGFFEVCRRQGLTGKQGVAIPDDNRDHLMLNDDVCQAVEAGQFHIFPVRRIEEVMELLTGRTAGRRGKNGRFPSGTLFRLVDERLAELTTLAEINRKRRR